MPCYLETTRGFQTSLTIWKMQNLIIMFPVDRLISYSLLNNDWRSIRSRNL